LDARDPSDDRWIAEEVATVLRLAPVTARIRLSRASMLVSHLRDTLSAMARGELTASHAGAIVDGVTELLSHPAGCAPDAHSDADADADADGFVDENGHGAGDADSTSPHAAGLSDGARTCRDAAAIAELERLALRRAADQTLSELRRTVARAVHRLDAVGAHQRHQRARADRGVFLRDAGRGMSEVLAVLAATDAAALYTRLDAAARMLPREDVRAVDQQRADLLVDGLLAGIPADGLPTAQGRCPQITVTMAMTTLLGQDELPAELVKHSGRRFGRERPDHRAGRAMPGSGPHGTLASAADRC
jgi:hypothetical protein